MKKTFSILPLLLCLSAVASDMGFRYKNGKCVNDKNEAGLNPSFFGQCSDLRNIVLGRFNLEGIDFSGSHFTNSDLQLTSFNRATLVGVNFEGANLAGVNLTGTILKNAIFQKAKLKRTQLSEAIIEHVDFSGADLSGSDFSFIEFKNSKFDDADFSGSNLEGAALINSSLVGTKFPKGILTDALLTSSDITNANFSEADLSRCELSLTKGSGAKFDSSNLNGANLSKAVLAAPNFSFSQLKGAVLSGGSFEKADFRRTDFTGAKLDGVNFKGSTYNRNTKLPFDKATADKMGMVFVQSGQVLILWDSKTPYLDSLVSYLRAQGAEVFLPEGNVTTFTGTNMANYTSVLHLNGTTFSEDMPLSGQDSIAAFVRSGGTYIYTEWLAFQIGNGQYANLKDFLLVSRVSGTDGPYSASIVAERANHPLLLGVQSNFTVDCSGNDGTVIDSVNTESFVKDSQGRDLVAAKNFGAGKVVALAFAGNYNRTCLADLNIQKIIFNAVNNL